jgi:hypothetical protein
MHAVIVHMEIMKMLIVSYGKYCMDTFLEHILSRQKTKLICAYNGSRI